MLFLRNSKNVVTLQSQTKSLQTYYKKRLLALVLAYRNPENFTNPKQESGKCPLVCLIRCDHNDEHIGVGIHCLFLLVRFFQYLKSENKQKEVPRFFYILPMGRLEPISQQINQL